MNCSQREEITICPYFVGKEGAIEGKLITEQGTARIDLTQKSDGLTSKSLQSIYDSQPFRNPPKFVKIDTDGFDLMIIRESLGFIEKYHPILFFEFDPFLFKKVEFSKENEIFELLENLGYSYGIEFDNLGKFLRKFSVKEEAKTQYISNKYNDSVGDIFSDIALFHFNDEEVFNKYLTEVTSKCV
jgi:hypothetical protein